MTQPPDLPVRLLELLAASASSARTVVEAGGRTPAPASVRDRAVPVDLLVLAPTAAQPRSSEWRSAASLAAATTHPDGVVYVVAPRRVRRRVVRLVEAAGFRAAASFAHVRDGGRTRYLVEVDPGAVAYALSRSIAGRRLTRWVSRHVFRFRLHRLFSAISPVIGVALQRPSASPLLAWTLARGGAAGGGAILTERRRGRFVVYRIGGEQSLLVKVAAAAVDVEREGRALDTLAATARDAGADVPARVAVRRGATDRPILAQTLIPGIPASELLAGKPRKVVHVLSRLAEWLAVWHRASTSARVVSRDILEEALLGPARLLEPRLGPEYSSWLERRCRLWTGTTMPAVHAHLDLTMANVLLKGNRGFGVVDWESARPDSLPLADFFYAAADAAAAVHQYADRGAAFRSAFLPGGRYFADVSELVDRLSREVELPSSSVELTFHACWLHHAANEARESRPTDPRPFLNIASVVSDWRVFFDAG